VVEVGFWEVGLGLVGMSKGGSAFALNGEDVEVDNGEAADVGSQSGPTLAELRLLIGVEVLYANNARGPVGQEVGRGERCRGGVTNG
jgi:hypothetical protein